MQKLLSALASLAAIILFAAVAVTSPATSAILGGYGLLYLSVVVPAVFAFLAFRDRIRSLSGWLFGIAAAAIPVYFVYRALAHSSEFSADHFERFGFIQVIGIFGLVIPAILATGLLRRRFDDYYRQCPHCLATIRREASRCRHCAGKVEPQPAPVRS
jgi:hypothetical protein